MAPLTWRNVDAPNFAGAIAAQDLVGRSIDRASTGILGAINSYQEGRAQSESARLMSSILQGGNASTALTGLDPRYLTGEALKFVADRQDQAAKLDLANRELALRGRNRGGRGSGDYIESSIGTNVKGYVDQNGQFTTTPVESVVPEFVPEATTPVAPPVQRTPAPTAPVENAPVATVDPTPTGSVAPVASMQDPNLAAIQRAIYTPERIAAATTSTPVTEAAPSVVQQVSALSQAVPGPIRVPPKVKGTDGLNFRDNLTFQDALNLRTLAIEDPAAATAALATSPRLGLSMTPTNGLKFAEENFNIAKAAEAVEASQRENREGARNEADTLRNRAINDQARILAEDAVPNFASANDAIASLDMEALGPTVWKETVDRIQAFDKAGAWKDYTSNAAQTIATVSAKADAKEGEKKGDKEEETPPDQPILPLSQTPESRALRESVTLARDQYNFDRNANTAQNTFFEGYDAAAADKTSKEELVNKLTGEGGVFARYSPESVRHALTTLSARFNVEEPVVALALADHTRTANALTDAIPIFRFGQNALVYDEDAVSNLLGQITDPETGKPRPEFLQRKAAVRAASTAMADISTLQGEYENAASQLQRARNLQSTGRKNLKIVDLEKKERDAFSKVQTALDRFMDRGTGPTTPNNQLGLAYANRGVPQYPAPGERATEEPGPRVTDGLTPRARALRNNAAAIASQSTAPQRQTPQAIYATLVNQLGRRPRAGEALQLRLRAQEMYDQLLAAQ